VCTKTSKLPAAKVTPLSGVSVTVKPLEVLPDTDAQQLWLGVISTL
jgi:hypothetical protein